MELTPRAGLVIFPDGLLGNIAGAASFTGATSGEGSEQQVDIGGTKGELFPRGFPWKGQCLWVGKVVYS